MTQAKHTVARNHFNWRFALALIVMAVPAFWLLAITGTQPLDTQLRMWMGYGIGVMAVGVCALAITILNYVGRE